VRHIVEPIEETFRREFPDYQPFPFGQHGWIHRLVRHILLSEPLVGDFGRCFESVGLDEAAKLADSFRFDACVQRERLVDVVREAAARAEPAVA
jgi:endoglucanase